MKEEGKGKEVGSREGKRGCEGEKRKKFREV